MKLIIDMPEEYKALFDTERCKSKFDSLATNEFGYVLRKAFENSTPLDDVRAEIVKAYEDATMYSCDEELSRFASRVCGILGNIGKAESEET